MKSKLIILTLTFLAATIGTASAEMQHDGHNNHVMQNESVHQGDGNHGMHAENGKVQGRPADNTIRQTMVDGNYFSYKLIDMRPKMANMAPEMKQQMKSHHLMVFIKDSSGNSFAGAKTGYLVEGPDGVKQKTMTMAMGGGFGADIDLAKKGSYNIRTKFAAGKIRLSDSFEYVVR